jgi:hypothetical protein
METNSKIKIEWYNMGMELSQEVKDEAIRVGKILIGWSKATSKTKLPKPQKDCVRIVYEDVPLDVLFKACDAIGWGCEDHTGLPDIPKEETPRFYQDGVEITLDEIVKAHVDWCKGVNHEH